jgi:hypothetical protein
MHASGMFLCLPSQFLSHLMFLLRVRLRHIALLLPLRKVSACQRCIPFLR